MSKRASWLIGAGVAVAMSAAVQAQQTAPAPAPTAKARSGQEDAIKKLAAGFYKPGASLEERLSYVSPDFIQHSPMVARYMELNNIKSGRDAFKSIENTRDRLNAGTAPPAAQGPKPPEGNVLYKVMVDGDLVTVIHERYRPDPGAKGKFYPIYQYDTFRVQNGKLAEHWDGAVLPDPLPIYLREPISKIQFPTSAKPAP
jgi:predicted SnoaL-like aldol condensation-catalyzing enzyme